MDALNRKLAEADNNNSEDKFKILAKISELRKESRTPPAQIETL